jgi:hypothetical protein
MMRDYDRIGAAGLGASTACRRMRLALDPDEVEPVPPEPTAAAAERSPRNRILALPVLFSDRYLRRVWLQVFRA